MHWDSHRKSFWLWGIKCGPIAREGDGSGRCQWVGRVEEGVMTFLSWPTGTTLSNQLILTLKKYCVWNDIMWFYYQIARKQKWLCLDLHKYMCVVSGKVANRMVLVFSILLLHLALPFPSFWTSILPIHHLPPLFLSSHSHLPHLRGVEPYDPTTTVLVQRHEPQGVSTILSSTDFFQSEHNRRVILEQVDSFQLREKYMFATTTRVRVLEHVWIISMLNLIGRSVLLCLVSLTENPAIWKGFLAHKRWKRWKLL